jgi:hypothetical protein
MSILLRFARYSTRTCTSQTRNHETRLAPFKVLAFITVLTIGDAFMKVTNKESSSMLSKRRVSSLTNHDPFTREMYVERFGLNAADLSDERVEKILTHKKALDIELRRLKAAKAAYPDERVAQVAKFFGLDKGDLQRPSIARLVKSILDGEDYLVAVRRHQETQHQ